MNELQRFRAAYPDIDAVQVFITDASGVPRGKSVRTSELEAIFRDGRRVAGSILGLDITGEDVEATGLVWEAGDADGLCRPVPGTLLPSPWLTPPTGQLMLTMYDDDAMPAAGDPRHALARIVARLEARGLVPVVACELEFYLLREANGRFEPAGRRVEGEPARIESYSLTRLDDLAPLFADVHAAAKAQGLPAETLMAEYAPGQFEITLHHRADALRAVDEAVLFKRLLRGVARRHGCIATFMAKPLADRAGSGLHIHVSLADRDGRNLFAAGDPAGTPLLRHAIGGMAATVADAFLVFAPNANSYRRYRSLSYAPVAPTWGVNNRTVSLRVPAGPPASRHVEHRIAGADANLYLAVATVLAGLEKGLDGQIDPGPPVQGNGYAIAPPRVFPATWHEAIERAAGSEFLRDALGADFMKVFLAVKRQECERFMAEVTPLDYAWYLRDT
ncbi:MAG: glutamine synthetase family protein [Steroidobacteraceae bacterium]